MYEKGTRVKVKIEPYIHFNIGNGRGTITAVNPYHPKKFVDVLFDNGRKVCNINVKDISEIDLERIC